MRMIDADKLKSELFDADWMMDNDEHMVEKIVERQPTVDAELVRHGEWIDTPIGTIECSECGCCSNLVGMFTHYCPNCGAKMDKKQNTNAKVKVIYMITLER